MLSKRRCSEGMPVTGTVFANRWMSISFAFRPQGSPKSAPEDLPPLVAVEHIQYEDSDHLNTHMNSDWTGTGTIAEQARTGRNAIDEILQR
jgi:hypothetical protein